MPRLDIWSWFKGLWQSEPEEFVPLDKNNPNVQKMIEMARKYQLEDYEVVHPTLHHYRFYFEDGTDYLTGIVGLVDIMDELKASGIFPYVNKDKEPAEVISLSEFKSKQEGDDDEI